MDNQAWAKYIEWSKTSRSVQAKYVRGRTIALALIAIGATFSGASGSMTSGSWSSLEKVFAFASAFAVAGAGFVGRHFISGDQERNWIMVRAAAEALKSHAFRYACAVVPYQDDTTADEELAHTILNIQERSKSISRVPATPEELQQKPGPQRHLPIEEYITTRASEQIDWYQKRAQAQTVEQQKYQNRPGCWVGSRPDLDLWEVIGGLEQRYGWPQSQPFQEPSLLTLRQAVSSF